MNTSSLSGLAPIGVPTTIPPVTHLKYSAPIIGARYWLSTVVGFEAGLGIGYSSSDGTALSSESGSDEESQEIFGGAVHLGLPLVPAYGRHYKLLILPEANVGFAQGSERPRNELRSAFVAQVGARVGAEIHFGFMGIPELSMQTGVGLFATYTGWRRYPDPESSSTGVEQFGRTLDINSTVGSSPWQFLNGNLAALYYFP